MADERSILARLTFWRRFSLRTLFVLMTACCVALGVWSIYVVPYRDQARSVAVITRLKGTVDAIPEKGHGWQRWLVTTMLGPDTFIRVESVNLSNRALTDDDARSLGALRFLKTLNVDQTPITDEGVQALVGLNNLTTLSMRFTSITDRGAATLASMPQIQRLTLTGTQISDDSISSLATHPELMEIFIRWTRVTPTGAEQLRQALPDCQIQYDQLRDVPSETPPPTK